MSTWGLDLAGTLADLTLRVRTLEQNVGLQPTSSPGTLYGTLANRPGASNVPPGGFFTAIDTGELYQVQSGQWVLVMPGFAGTPISHAHLFNSQAVAANVYTKVLLDTIDSGPFDTVNHRYNVPISGSYLVIGEVQGQFGSGTNSAGIEKNGTFVARGTEIASNTGYGLVVADVVPCVAGDYLELVAYSQAGGTLSGQGLGWQCYLTVARLR